MADFYQTGVIATLHRLGEGDLGNVERQLEYFSRQQPIAVVLPALYSEFQKPAMDTILATDEFFADPLGAPPIPNWMRVSAALPGFLDDLREAVDADNEVLTGAGRLWAAG